MIEKYDLEGSILELFKIKEILDKKINNSYFFSGSVNDFYVLYCLGVTRFNPLDYGVMFTDHFKVNVNVPIDYEVNFNAPENVCVCEKEILTVFQGINLQCNVDVRFNSDNVNRLRKLIDAKKCLHKTAYEEILVLEDFNQFRYLSELEKEFQLTWVKYNNPRIYYSNVLEYLKDKVNLEIVLRFGNDIDGALDYFQNFNAEILEEYTYAFYKIIRDYKENVGKLDFEVVDCKIVFMFFNIVFFEARLMCILDTISQIMVNNVDRKVKLLVYDGNGDWYSSKVVANYCKQDYKIVKSLLNPLSPLKYEGDIDVFKLIDVLCKFRNFKLEVRNGRHLSKDISNTVISTDTEMVIIDNFEFMYKRLGLTKDKLLSDLNSLNVPVIIFEYPKEIHTKACPVKKSEIKYFDLKSRYTCKFYSVSRTMDDLNINEIVCN